ncbi:hypothetical protein V2J09_002089 [Rumex salicifolius]
MATLSSSSSSFFSLHSTSSPVHSHTQLLHHSSTFPHLRLKPIATVSRPRQSVLFASASSSSSFDDFDSGDGITSRPKKMLLSDLIQEIEPLDVSLIQRDVPPTTIDAMKRTISGMLGLLPSNQFQILVEALWELLSKLLISSMMTGYTLRNAEYRLCLEKNLDINVDNAQQDEALVAKSDASETLLDDVKTTQVPHENSFSSNSGDAINPCEELNVSDLGDMAPEVQSYILHLQSHLSSVKKELSGLKRKNAALQMQQFVGEEKNDLLDYLRSLQPEKVAELSQPTSLEVREIIHSVVHGLLATLSPTMHTKAPPPSEKNTGSTLNMGNEECGELIENTSLHFQPMISLTRDYLARCMLLGHYLRGLEYRTELMDLLSLSSDSVDDISDKN